MLKYFFFLLCILHFHPIGSQNIIGSLLQLWGNALNDRRNDFPDNRYPDREYDFIVIGAGTAGCALASRLSEISKWKVLLIEAGDEELLFMDIPLWVSILQFSAYNYRFLTEPKPGYCMGFKNRRCHFPRGKVMGGSSVLNYMIYTRGAKEDFDNWEDLGNPGWSWNSILPYFQKAESVLKVEYLPYRSENVMAYMNAVAENGDPLNNINSNLGAMGTDFIQSTSRKGLRLSSNRAYIRPIRDRKNLHVAKMSMVQRILLERDPNTGQLIAKGVEILDSRTGRRYEVKAKREVILSAGALASPQLLMLSGIGPAGHLQEKGIEVKLNLTGVGENLQDHVSVGGIIFSSNTTADYNTEQGIFQLNKLLSERNGSTTVPGGCEAVGFFHLDTDKHTSWPDIELMYIGGSALTEPQILAMFNTDQQIIREVYAPYRAKNSWQVFPMLMRPRSRGVVRLKKVKAGSEPYIDPRYFTDKRDLQLLLKGIRKLQKIASMPALRHIDSKIHAVPLPGCKHLKWDSDAYWKCHARYFSNTIYHQSGTCKMGLASDPFAVVNARLKVHGVSNLRVVDASIMPTVTSAHTNAPTYMIAEKAADMIKQDWGEI